MDGWRAIQQRSKMNTNTHSRFRFVALSGVLVLLLALSCVAHDAKDSGKVTSLAISPDGSLVAATFEKGPRSIIYVIPVSTGKAVRLKKNEAGDESSPAFSPDGKRVIFSYWPLGESHSQVVLANVDGSGMKALPSGQFNELLPVLSSDNQTVVFYFRVLRELLADCSAPFSCLEDLRKQFGWNQCA